MKQGNRHLPLAVISLLICLLSFGTIRAQTVSCQTALSDSVFLNVVMSYALDRKPRLTLDKAYMTKRRKLKREPVTCKRMNYNFEKKKKKKEVTEVTDSPDDVAFTFSFSFSYEKRSYRVQGRYTEAAGGEPECVLRCVPTRLSDKTLRESEYQY